MILLGSISYYDQKEDFYHGLIAGLFIGLNYKVESNKEYGNGRPDLVIYPYDCFEKTFVFEFKYVDTLAKLKSKCEEAVEQIKDNHYLEGLKALGYENVVGIGIAFYEKQCFIKQL